MGGKELVRSKVADRTSMGFGEGLMLIFKGCVLGMGEGLQV